MAENNMSKDFEKALNDYFNSPVKVFECGNEEDKPERFQDRPCLKSLPNGHTVYIQKTQETASMGAFSLSLDTPVTGGSIESSTENSQFLHDMQERFRNVKKDVNLIIIDPDVVRGRYAMDSDPRRSLLLSFYQYLYTKMEQDGVAKAIPLKGGDYQSLLEASVLDNSPLSLSVPVKGLGQYAIVVSTQPDMPMHDMFTAIPGSTIRMKNQKLGKDHVRDMILFHELGHALDTLNKYNQADTISDSILKRHRTESVADCFSVLQTAKKYGSTDVGKLVSDIRIDSSAQGFAYIQKVMAQSMRKAKASEPDVTMRDFSNVLRENYEEQTFFASPEMKDFIKARKAQNKLSNNDEINSNPTNEEILNNIEANASLHKVAKVLGSISSYTTSFCADAAIKVAEDKLKDGSLQTMSDKELHKLSEDIVAKESFSKEQITGLVMGMITGQQTPELIKVMTRYQEAQKRFPNDPQKQMEMQMQAMGMPVPKPELTNEEAYALDQWWRREMAEKIEKTGANREGLVETIEGEKDKARKNDKLLNQYKIAVMNQVFMENPEGATDKAKTFGTVRDTLRAIETPKIEETGAKAVEAFIKTELKALEAGEKAVAMATTRDIATMSPIDFAKAVAKEGSNLKKLYQEEKKSQALAFAIRKDPEAWAIASTSPIIAQKVEEKAKQKHPIWIEGVHFNLGQKNAGDLNASMAEIEGNKKLLAYGVAQTPLAGEVNKGLVKKLSAELAPATPKTKMRTSSTKKRREFTEGGEIQWNLLKNKGASK